MCWILFPNLELGFISPGDNSETICYFPANIHVGFPCPGRETHFSAFKPKYSQYVKGSSHPGQKQLQRVL